MTNIIQAIKDENLFRGFLADDEDSIASWSNWLTALRVVYGLPVKKASKRRLVEECTGRNYDQLPANGFDTALFLTGRRSGKSRASAIISAHEACIAGRRRLARGEKGLIAICAPTKAQGRVVRDYLRAIFEAEMLADLVGAETKTGFELNDGKTRIEILAGDFKTVRGFTLVAAVVDELAFYQWDIESKVRSDTELMRAIKPSLVSSHGKGRIVAISSPFARRGWCFRAYNKYFGNDAGRTLVWNCPSRTMNPTLPQSVVDEAMEEDLQAAKSEYLGEFRDDVAAFISSAALERLVLKGQTDSLLPRENLRYSAFVDMSGGRGDDAALAIAHREDKIVVLDFLRAWRPPFNPHAVIQDICSILRKYNLRRICGDNYSAEFCSSSFESNGVHYTASEKIKSQLYAELLPRLTSESIRLLDNPKLVNQLASLERRTRSGGRDIIDHPPGQHDDLANVVAGVSYYVSQRMARAGAIFR